MSLIDEIDDYRTACAERTRRAASRAALQVLCGIDLDHAESAPGSERRALCLRLERLIEKERIKGSARHWSYDLNRHIALKQALESLRRSDAPNGTGRHVPVPPRKSNG